MNEWSFGFLKTGKENPGVHAKLKFAQPGLISIYSCRTIVFNYIVWTAYLQRTTAVEIQISRKSAIVSVTQLIMRFNHYVERRLISELIHGLQPTFQRDVQRAVHQKNRKRSSALRTSQSSSVNLSCF